MWNMLFHGSARGTEDVLVHVPPVDDPIENAFHRRASNTCARTRAPLPPLLYYITYYTQYCSVPLHVINKPIKLG